jgi:hypothetical protein
LVVPAPPWSRLRRRVPCLLCAFTPGVLSLRKKGHHQGGVRWNRAAVLAVAAVRGGGVAWNAIGAQAVMATRAARPANPKTLCVLPGRRRFWLWLFSLGQSPPPLRPPLGLSPISASARAVPTLPWGLTAPVCRAKFLGTYRAGGERGARHWHGPAALTIEHANAPFAFGSPLN